jgi:hypothetical protein
MFMVSTVTARKWAARLRAEGPAGMADRSSRPRHCPHRTPAPVRRQILELRWRQRLGPVQIGGRLGVASSTVHAVLTRAGVNRLSRIDRTTGEPIRRYEHPHPGAMIHVDVTKFGNIPDGGGHRFLTRLESRHNAQVTARRTGERGRHYRPVIGTAFVHPVIDDHSRVAYVEICADEKAETAVGVLNEQSPGSRTAVSQSNEFSPTTAAATAPLPGAMPALCSGSLTNEPGPTGPRPTARANGSTAPSPTDGPTPGSTAQRPTVEQPCPDGSTSTITTGPTPPSAARPSAGSTTCLDITPRAPHP